MALFEDIFCVFIFRGVFLTFESLTFTDFLEKHYALSRSTYPDVSLGNSLREIEKLTPKFIASFFSREQKLCSTGAILAKTHIFLHNTNCWLLYCIHTFQMRIMPSFVFSIFLSKLNGVHFCSFCLKNTGIS